LACAAGYAVTSYIIENKVPENAYRMGGYMIGKLKELQNKYPFIKDVRGCGLLIAVEFDREIAEAIMYACLEKGLVINHLKANLLRIIPPLIISKAEIDEGIGILDTVLAGVKIK